jgi:nicotinamidase-related amidase
MTYPHQLRSPRRLPGKPDNETPRLPSRASGAAHIVQAANAGDCNCGHSPIAFLRCLSKLRPPYQTESQGDRDMGNSEVQLRSRSEATAGAHRHLLARASVAVVLAAALGPAQARTIVDEWAEVKAPSAPELKSVKADPKDTALLVLDIVRQNCTPRPRCMASVPKIQGLVEKARQAGAPVVYALVSGQAVTDVLPEVAPRAGEPSVASGPDKFMNTDLDKILKDKGIKNVIVTGTAAEGAVLNTAAGAALRGYKVIVPVDGMSSTTPYAEQYTAWHLTNAPRIGAQGTLTRIDLVGF